MNLIPSELSEITAEMSHQTVEITLHQADVTRGIPPVASPTPRDVERVYPATSEPPTDEHIRQRSDLPCVPSPTLPAYDNMMLTPGELSLMFEDREFPQQTVDAFPDEPAVVMTLQSYAFIALTIRSLERNLERHRREQEILFSSLNHSRFI